MDAPHEAHLMRVLTHLVRDVDQKYRAGQLEHDGRLWEKPRMLEHAIEEVLDLAVYLYTLKEQRDGCSETMNMATVCNMAPIKQSRRMSVVETLTNVVVGYVVACITQLVVFPLFGLSVPWHANLLMGGAFTVVSIVRSYTLRRIFNWL